MLAPSSLVCLSWQQTAALKIGEAIYGAKGGGGGDGDAGGKTGEGPDVKGPFAENENVQDAEYEEKQEASDGKK